MAGSPTATPSAWSAVAFVSIVSEYLSPNWIGCLRGMLLVEIWLAYRIHSMLRCQKLGLQTAASRGVLAIACVNALYPDQALFIRLALQRTLCRALMLGLVTSRLSLLGFEGPGDSWRAYKQHAMESPNKVLASLVCLEHSISILGWLLTDWKDESQADVHMPVAIIAVLPILKKGFSSWHRSHTNQ